MLDDYVDDEDGGCFDAYDGGYGYATVDDDDHDETEDDYDDDVDDDMMI